METTKKDGENEAHAVTGAGKSMTERTIMCAVGLVSDCGVVLCSAVMEECPSRCWARVVALREREKSA